MSLPTFSQEDVEVENQLRRAKKDNEQLDKERAKVRQATLDDYQQFKEYQQRARQQFGALKQKNDSLNQVASRLRGRNSGLGANINGIKSRQREYDINQEKLRGRLEELCDTLLQITEVLSPMLSEKQSASIRFLKSEIHAATSDNMESMSRLFSILTELENRLMDIEVDQGSSPLPSITGIVYRLRIGGIYESIVNENGTQAALWNAQDRKWEAVDDKDVAARIRKAISIRAGKTVPELVTLPLSLKKD
ncbi:MAG: DUF3450 family protein [Fibrobacteria bacterium]